ncbi:MAG: anti-FecI sigma factor, FecR [Verrucomicrobia bacterium]|nr:anti-FecI sigma factor, FecR [Verrucomicrobiota bacterium]
MASIRDAAAAWKTRADAGLHPNEEAKLRDWLDADPRHRTALERFDLVWQTFDRPFHAGAVNEVLQELSTRAGRRRRRTIAAVTGAAVLLVVGSMWRFGGFPNAINSEVAKPVVAANAILLLPERRVLPDGSVAELRAGARIAMDYSPGFRRVTLLKGEVHFQVTKDPSRPFIVSAGGVEARAVGTAFLVGLRSDAVEVLVTEGRVSVNQPDHDPAAGSPSAAPPLAPARTEPLALVEAGKGILVGMNGQASSPQLTAVDPALLDDHLSWRAPRVEFTRTSLAEAIAVLNGYSAGRRSAGQRSVQFMIDDPALNDVRISGLFRVDRTEAFVNLLKQGFGIDAEQRGDSEILLRRPR